MKDLKQHPSTHRKRHSEAERPAHDHQKEKQSATTTHDSSSITTKKGTFNSLFHPIPNLTPRDSISDPGHMSLPQKDMFFTYQNGSHTLDPDSLKSSGYHRPILHFAESLQNPPKAPRPLLTSRCAHRYPSTKISHIP
ncbi:hypothetical protein AC579_10409 [Pseudocercospora musae]|uniref:Uncharacterized protein n=1 Tax=Pseudocercospora musae TaxID=113226 RepID=A0A139IM85_9PEZI|nr:hypothetical protein AC579_10409 [Pseudocercospora musae]